MAVSSPSGPRTLTSPASPPRRSRLRTAWTVLCVLAIGALAGALAVTIVGPLLCGARTLVVETGSMSPAIHAGDLAIVRPVDAQADIATGDIVTYQATASDGSGRPAETLVTHRVIGLGARDGELLVTTQGDANNTPDPPVPFSNIRGELWYVVPKAGYVTVWVQGHSLWLIGAAAAIWAGSLIVDRRRRRTTGRSREEEASLKEVAG